MGEAKNRCFFCDCYDEDFGCTMSSFDKAYACPLNEMTEKDFEEQDKKIKCVCDNTSSISRLVQLGEECAEFIQALHKYLRKQLGDNPTPKTEEEILANIKEELMDIQLSLDCISADLIDYDIYQKKLDRWVSRLTVDLQNDLHRV